MDFLNYMWLSSYSFSRIQLILLGDLRSVTINCCRLVLLFSIVSNRKVNQDWQELFLKNITTELKISFGPMTPSVFRIGTNDCRFNE